MPAKKQKCNWDYVPTKPIGDMRVRIGELDRVKLRCTLHGEEAIIVCYPGAAWKWLHTEVEA